ncbi:ATPase family associated with various cellular activities (AAA) [Popillia japonica]|uniref:ATPase family associated with various cellular activities (AAA) n=1 Tax=Popillia japonica TaxID=7064 RepID=A0AAW1IXY3_POPJA
MDYPTEEEEFELMYSDELELIREQEEILDRQRVTVSNKQVGKPPPASNQSINNDFPTEEEEFDLVPRNTLKQKHSPTHNSAPDNGFPTEDEEFELTHSDDWELLKEQDIGERIPKSRKSLNFDKAPQNSATHNGFNDENDTNQPNNVCRTNKRSIQELFGDIDDLLSEDATRNYESVSKKRKKGSKENADLALIEHILTLRKLSHESTNPVANFGKTYTSALNRNSENLSNTIPKYPFIAVNNHNGERMYVRFHSEEYEKEEMKRVTDRKNFAGIMGKMFKDIWREATDHINYSMNLAEDAQMEVADITTSAAENKNLWVDLYKPRKYYELLSDESTNRTLLRWLKLWDKIVFNIKPKVKPMKVNEKEINNKFKKRDLPLELDEHGRPQYKVALLCGPPGLGKTTLAHMVARHAGYNVVEINASDDRNLESFKTALENATSMRSVLDQEKRPNCLVFDEIDGAPSASIDFLIKFINGNHVTKSKKGKTRTQYILKRPIICICNDVYVPALRALRQIAFVVRFPPTSAPRLAERLSEIAKKEQIKTDMGAMLALAEKSHNDIRACLSFLHFFKSQSKPVTLTDVIKTNIGEKDVQKGLFAVWDDIFQIPRIIKKDSDDKRNFDSSLKTRMAKVLHTINAFGDYERVTQGVFENYPKMKVKDSTLVGTCEALDWFCLNDQLNKHVLTKQDYSLATYLPYGFVVWHFVFATVNWQRINYPSTSYEIRTRKIKQQSLRTELIRGMRPSIRAYLNPICLKMDIVPYLNQIIVPNLRPVNLHLYTPQEKEQLHQVVNTMIDYNLNYVQERTAEGSYVYNLDPDLEEISNFPGFKSKRNVTYANRQLIAREIELEKMRIVEQQRNGNTNTDKKEKVDKEKPASTQQPQNVPNHMKKLQAKKVRSEVIIKRDFFGNEIRIDASNSDKSNGPRIYNDIFYQFKEGFTNAVRKKIKIKQLK